MLRAVSDVASDGSPVRVYAALPAEPELGRIRSLLVPGARVLDLGCGTGRISNPLVAEGHVVVAVDDSETMLAHVIGAETVIADVWTLELGRRFDVVLALSHLINHPDRSRRRTLLQVCRNHLADDGVVVVQRYPPDWVPTNSEGASGDVVIKLHDIAFQDSGVFDATVTYLIGDQSWSQAFEAMIVDDDELRSLALESGLTINDIGDVGGWVVMSATGEIS
jgi:SAM-dependent methyltransferase